MTSYRWSVSALVLAGIVAAATTVRTQGTVAAGKPVLYVTATAHLDSQWNWTVQDTIRQYVPNTFYTNFKYFDQYPDYTFTYEGAIHYMWFKEYHPDDWATVQKYVANGRWRLAGSWIDAVDTNVPSPESLMRQALYGQHFFQQEFHKTSHDVYLPDCFGFGFALPSIAKASGLDAFTTQKLTWGSSVPIPFPVGRWRGVDGSEVVANLNPGDYVTKITSDIATDPKWSNDVTPVGGGASVGFRLFGTGDIGGGPDPTSIDWLEKSLHDAAPAVEIRNTSADQLSQDLTPAQKAALPVYEGELTMQTHGVGCYTSQAAMKKFNRQNELLADEAERAGVTARLLGGLAYPTARLRDAWTRVLWHQFHDDLTGTCIPQAYQFSWNDELSASNQFAGVLTNSTAVVANLLDTHGTGAPLVVFNPISAARHDLVHATVDVHRNATRPLRVVDRETGRRVDVHVNSVTNGIADLTFVADMPSVGYKAFDVVGTTVDTVKDGDPNTPSGRRLESARYAVTIDDDGDISSIVDKAVGHELLKAPIRLEMRDDPSPDKPAWRILYDTVTAPVREYVDHPTFARVVVTGDHVQPMIEVRREAAGSTIVQRISLPEDQDRIDVDTTIDWKSPNTLLKVAFPLAASNPKATYDLGLGVIERSNNTPKAYEVPAQQWADITDTSGTFGVAILNDSKYGWDKPADNILRLTLLHTAQPRATPYQGSNDLGHHHFVYSIVGHRGDWREGRIPEKAAALNQPLVAFQTTAHTGALGTAFSLATLSDRTGQFAIKALKGAEDSDEIVIRLQERYGQKGSVQLNMGRPIASARAINAAEEAIGPLAVSSGAVALDFTPYQPRTIAVRLAAPTAPAATRPATETMVLPFNLDGVSTDKNPADGDFDGKGHTISGDLLPATIDVDGVPFKFGPSAPGAHNVLVPSGQAISIPAGFDRVYIVATAVGGDVPATFRVGNMSTTVVLREWEGAIGQWDSRLKSPSALREPFLPSRPNGTPTLEEVRAGMTVLWDPQTFALDKTTIANLTPGFVKRDEIAWIGTHRHSATGNQPYVMSYLFLYELTVPRNAHTVTLPTDSRIRILAMTAAVGGRNLKPAQPLYAADLPDPADAPPTRPAGRHQ
jgi:alpha-mannosidase